MKRISICLIILLGYISVGQTQNVSLYAGIPNTSGYNSTGVALSNAKFNQPYGIIRDGQGNLWISETGGQLIYMVTTNNMVYVRAGSYTNSGYVNSSGVNARFYDPKGMGIGPNDEIYIADYSNNVIRRLSPFASLGNVQTVTTFCGKQGTSGGYVNGSASVAEFNGPTDICVDNSGNLYVSDFKNHVIRKISSNGTASLFAGQPNSSGSTNGNATTKAKFNGPSGLYLKDSILYVTDSWGSSIRKISINSGWVSTVKSAFWTPTDILEYDGSLYFTDQHRVGRIANNTLTTYAGSSTLNQSGYKNGFDTAARFYNVKSMIFQASDTSMLIIDSDNHVIRKVTLCPTITPSVTMSGSTTFCAGDSVVLTGPGGYASYKWSTNDTTQSIVVKKTSTITLTVKNANQCSGTSAPISITRKAVPTANFSMDTTACLGLDESITYTGNAGSSASYNWDFDGGNIMSGSGQGPYTVRWSASGMKKVTLEVKENGCTSTTVSKNINAYPIPTANFKNKSIVCAFEHDTISFTGQASASATYNWDFDGAIIVSGSAAGPYIVYWKNHGSKILKLTVTDHYCTSTQSTSSVNIQSIPISTFNSKTFMCLGDLDTITFTGSAGASAVYNWDFDGGNIISGSGSGPFVVEWLTSGSKTITLDITENGCSSVQSKVNLQINPVPTSSFKIKNTSCTFINDTIQYTGNATTGATYTWNFDGATVLSGSGQGPYILHWQTAGTKTVSLKVSENGCESNIKIEQVLLTEAPIAAFACPTSVCQDQQVTVTFFGTAGATAVYDWDFDGATVISGTGAGPYVVQWTSFGIKVPNLSITENDCVSNFYTLTVTVNQKPTSYFTIATKLCIDEQASVDYVGNASAGADYSWNFGSATVHSGSGQGPYLLSWATEGAKQLTLQVNEASCYSGITTRDLDVYPNPPVPTITKTGNTLISSAASNNQWYDMAGLIMGAVDQTYDPAADGIYYVIVNNAHGCSSRSADFNFVKVGLSEQFLTDIIIYPNPAKNHLIIEHVDHTASEILLSIHAVDGKLLVMRSIGSGKQEIDISKLEKGLYILSINTDKEIKIIKLVKD